jgi:hypothetical protein
VAMKIFPGWRYCDQYIAQIVPPPTWVAVAVQRIRIEETRRGRFNPVFKEAIRACQSVVEGIASRKVVW